MVGMRASDCSNLGVALILAKIISNTKGREALSNTSDYCISKLSIIFGV